MRNGRCGCTCVICCILVTTSPKSLHSLINGDTCDGEAGCLATVVSKVAHPADDDGHQARRH